MACGMNGVNGQIVQLNVEEEKSTMREHVWNHYLVVCHAKGITMRQWLVILTHVQVSGPRMDPWGIHIQSKNIVNFENQYYDPFDLVIYWCKWTKN